MRLERPMGIFYTLPVSLVIPGISPIKITQISVETSPVAAVRFYVTVTNETWDEFNRWLAAMLLGTKLHNAVPVPFFAVPFAILSSHDIVNEMNGLYLCETVLKILEIDTSIVEEMRAMARTTGDPALQFDIQRKLL